MIGIVLLTASIAEGEPPDAPMPETVKVAAVQISGYDKGDVPRDGFDPTDALVPYIDRAGEDGAQLVVYSVYSRMAVRRL